ncbi:hypothetical protein BDW75DRAFT_243314 [Aspergillus navahoensis]
MPPIHEDGDDYHAHVYTGMHFKLDSYKTSPYSHIRGRLEEPRAHRILWLLEELKVPYKLQTFKRDLDKFAPKALRDIHPLRESPIITIPLPRSESPLVLIQSGFIAEYLCDRLGGEHLIPKRFADAGKDGGIESEV